MSFDSNFSQSFSVSLNLLQIFITNRNEIQVTGEESFVHGRRTLKRDFGEAHNEESQRSIDSVKRVKLRQASQPHPCEPGRILGSVSVVPSLVRREHLSQADKSDKQPSQPSQNIPPSAKPAQSESNTSSSRYMNSVNPESTSLMSHAVQDRYIDVFGLLPATMGDIPSQPKMTTKSQPS